MKPSAAMAPSSEAMASPSAKQQQRRSATTSTAASSPTESSQIGGRRTDYVKGNEGLRADDGERSRERVYEEDE